MKFFEPCFERTNDANQTLFSVIEHEGEKLAVLNARWVVTEEEVDEWDEDEWDEDDEEYITCEWEYYDFWQMPLEQKLERGYALRIGEKGIPTGSFEFDYGFNHGVPLTSPTWSHAGTNDEDELEAIEVFFDEHILFAYDGEEGQGIEGGIIPEDIPCGNYWIDGML